MLGSSPSRPHAPVTLENWQTADQLTWTFQHVADLFPTAPIAHGPVVGELIARPSPVDEIAVELLDGSRTSVAQVMATTHTDGWIVVHGAEVLAETYPGGMAPSTAHLLMSVSKSLVGVVTGALVAAGTIAVDALASYYVPALEGCGYAGATVRHLLDMRSGIAFSEDYLDPNAEVRRLEQALGWAPRTDPSVPGNVPDFLLTLQAKGPHGGPFEYRSCESDVLGWVCEAAAGVRMAPLLSSLVWTPMGAEFGANLGVDATGAGLFDGGVSATLRDLARFGVVLARGGVSLTGQQVVPTWWVDDTSYGEADSRDAFAAGPVDNGMPGGMYRNQFWQPYPEPNVLVALGIHGQMIYIDRAKDFVAAKLSGWPTPQDRPKLSATLRAFRAIAAHV